MAPSSARKSFVPLPRPTDLSTQQVAPTSLRAMGKLNEPSKLPRGFYVRTIHSSPLMAYRSTPVAPAGVSPCQLLMGRRINTRIPTLKSNLLPQWPDLDKVRATDQKAKATNSYYYNRQHGVRPLSKLQPGNTVRIKPGWGEDMETSRSSQVAV